MSNYNVSFAVMQERIEGEQTLLEFAKKIKDWSNASEKACMIFAKHSLIYSATTTSGYSMGEYIYFAFKGNKFACYNNTSSYKGNAKKYNRYITFGEIVINFKSKKQFKECIDAFYKYVLENPNTNTFAWSKYIDLEQSKIKEKYIIKHIQYLQQQAV